MSFDIKDFFLGQLADMISSEISRNILESRLNSFKEIFVSGSRTHFLRNFFSLKTESSRCYQINKIPSVQISFNPNNFRLIN